MAFICVALDSGSKAQETTRNTCGLNNTRAEISERLAKKVNNVSATKKEYKTERYEDVHNNYALLHACPKSIPSLSAYRTLILVLWILNRDVSKP